MALFVFHPFIPFRSASMAARAQVAPPDETTQTKTALPFPAQLKKSVVLIQTDCAPAPGAFTSLPPEEQEKWNRNDLSTMKPESLAVMKPSYVGTGFFTVVQDPRISGKGQFVYLITNRHVMQPGIEDASPCIVLGYHISFNAKLAENSSESKIVQNDLPPNMQWTFSEDESVDLAVLPIVVNPGVDYELIPTEQFLTQELIDNKSVIEGDPVIFAGLFLQYRGATRFEPVVRTGTLAMLPSESVDTTLKKPGKIYFAEAHSYGGNSGSPIYVDIRKFANPNPGGFDFRLLGVVSGFVNEKNDFTLQVSTDYKGYTVANSGICVVVPAAEIMKILNSSRLQALRDHDVKILLDSQKH
jgi:hypothetical protein